MTARATIPVKMSRAERAVIKAAAAEVGFLLLRLCGMVRCGRLTGFVSCVPTGRWWWVCGWSMTGRGVE